MNDDDFEKFLNDGNADDVDDDSKIPVPCIVNNILKEKSKLLVSLMSSSLQAYKDIGNESFRNIIELYLGKLMGISLQTLSQFDYLATECEEDPEDEPPLSPPKKEK